MIEFDTFEAEWKEDSSGSWVSFRVHDRETALKTAQMLIDSKAYVVTLKEKRVKRSLDANAYFHLLVNKIAAKTGQSDDEVKRGLVSRYGTFAKDDKGQYIAAKLPEYADITAIYPYTRLHKVVEENGVKWNCYLFYKRTSDLDSKEMSRVIDGTVSEAKELGIDTDLPTDIKYTEV